MKRLLSSVPWAFLFVIILSRQQSHAQMSAGPFSSVESPTLKARIWWADYDAGWGPIDGDGSPTLSPDFIAVGFNPASPGLQPMTRLYRNFYGNDFISEPASLLGVNAEDSPKSGAWFDFDNDGRPDFIVSGITNAETLAVATVLWRNMTNEFSLVSTAFPAFLDASIVPGDFDNDGKTDLLIGGRSVCQCAPPAVQLWKNLGAGSFSNVPVALTGLDGQAIAVADFDKDGFLDLAMNGHDGSNYVTRIWRNDRAGNFTVASAQLPGFGGILNAADFDNDGWQDLLLGGDTLSPLVDNDDAELFAHVFRNNHDGTFSRAIDVQTLRPQSAAVGDYDNDGYLDAVINGFDETLENHDGEYVTRLFRNTGSAFTNTQWWMERKSSTLSWVDFDVDGKLDLSFSGRESDYNYWQTEIFRNKSPAVNSPPGAPTNLTVTIVSNGVWLSWSPAVDDWTPQAGLTYNVRVGTGSELGNIVSPLSRSNGFRLVALPGNAGSRTNYFLKLPTPEGPYGATARYYWSVQAVDGAFSGGAFAHDPQTGGESVFVLHSAPYFYSIQRLPNGNVSILVLGTGSSLTHAYGTYRMESSDDMITWNDRGPILNLFSNGFPFEDTTASNAPMRFYRVRYP